MHRPEAGSPNPAATLAGNGQDVPIKWTRTSDISRTAGASPHDLRDGRRELQLGWTWLDHALIVLPQTLRVIRL